jgi:alpha-beta hydrolase superfamily lysophospholipase
MQHLEREMIASDCSRLFAQSWLPADRPGRVVVLAHGLAEHSGRYADFAQRLAGRGVAVHALDHRGHGRSPGRRANIECFDTVVEDLAVLVTVAAQQHPGIPVTLLGHSMGGAIALACALRHPGPLHDLVLSAPALAADPAVSRLQVRLVRFLSRWLPDVGALKLPADAISRDPAVVRKYQEDPLVHRGAVPARTLAELFDAMAMFPTTAGALRLPVLVLHGTGDTLVELAHCNAVYERIGSPDKTVNVYDGLYHEVLNEPERERVIADLLAWLDAHPG